MNSSKISTDSLQQKQIMRQQPVKPVFCSLVQVDCKKTSMHAECDLGKRILPDNRLSAQEDANKLISPNAQVVEGRLSAFVQVRILLKILEREDRELRDKASRAIRFCQGKSKEQRGGPSLAFSICTMLRLLVGDKRWQQAEQCRRRIMLQSVSRLSKR
uniref:Uncharacterized protein n=1 Tax=Odontella aurita TaxID=265563 RepID=A0A7S4IFF1_9STRA|mmetsp:Transcript_24294/g.71428  ORF Transcript_24294/g.71428 Transcript_24294/m.71428 type:complete len:159 (+) Transcript_24294:218-694(+)